jgi:hypothetical protein
MGWHVVFRDGNVYAYKNLSPGVNATVLSLPVNNGEWMEKAEDPGNWKQIPLTDELREDLSMAAAVCYCSSLADGNCDFCGQTRSAKLALADSDAVKDAIKKARFAAFQHQQTYLIVWNAYSGVPNFVRAEIIDHDDRKQAFFTVHPDGHFEEGRY